MQISPALQKAIDQVVPKAEQGRFVEESIKKGLADYKLAHAKTVEIFVDGGSRGNPGSAGGGFAVYVGGKEAMRGSEFYGHKTNNQAEYLALRTALRETYSKYPESSVLCHMYSQLVVEQMNGNYKVKSEDLRPLFNEVQRIVGQFRSFQIKHIAREQNRVADKMANEAMDRAH
jgi:ribonuclease HI